MDFHLWLLYLVAAFGLSVSPGPNGLLALTHGALYGPRRTLNTITGGVSGFMLVMALSLFGISAILKTSADALLIMKVVGGLYLVWLGVQLWLSPAMQVVSHTHVTRSDSHLFRTGFLSAISNPKAILFFSAFLSQFVDPDRALVPQFLIMALTFAVTEFSYELVVANTADKIRPWLAKSGRTFNRSCGAVFAAIGIYLPLNN